MMSDDKKITADDLAKISVSLSLFGYGLALLALEKADEETKESKDNTEIESVTRALNNLLKRRRL